jgi:nucleoside-diphosphate-sugar epimerase
MHYGPQSMAYTAQNIILRDLNYICANLEHELRAMSGQRLLITGGAGFLGYYLVQSILHANRELSDFAPIEVHVHDNFMRGVPSWLTALGRDPLLVVTKRDVIEPLPNDGVDFDYIVHGASVASPIYYRLHPIETMDANVSGIRNLLDYCKQRAGKVRGLLFFSSSEIYGDPSPNFIPTPETYRGYVSCTGPRACYDESKRYGETLCVNYARQYKTPVTIARPFNNYGPGLKITDRRALPDFARNVLNGQDINLYSNGRATRTFCYVADAIVGYYKILALGIGGEAYNIGVEAPEIKINELADCTATVAAALFNYKGKIRQAQSSDRDYVADNPQRRCPSIEKARRDLSFDPKVSLEDGIRSSLLWYNEHREGEEA